MKLETKKNLLQQKIVNKIEKIENVIYKRGDVEKLKNYNTGAKVHKKQIAFHKCTKRNRWVFGGNRSGKTECGAVESVWLARGNHPFKANKQNVSGWVVSLSTQVQRDVAQKKVLSYLNKNWIVDVSMLSGRKDNLESGIIDTISIRNVFGGISQIGFKSCDQGREKFQGTSLDFVWFDEEPPEDIYKECKMRVIDKRGEIFGTMTPLKGLTWVYNQIYLNQNNDDEIWTEHIDWNDNPYLNKEEIKALEKSMSKEELDARKYGKFTANGGQVYTEFDENVNVIDPFDVPKEWFDNISIDPGLSNPLSCHFYACDYDGNIYVIAEHYESNKTCEYHANAIKEICKKLNWPKASNGMFSALIDSAASQRTLSSPKNVVDLFYDNGILVNTKVNKDLFSGINRVKYYLKSADGKSRLFIFKTCTNLIREIKSYFWGNEDAPVKKDDHCLDELRYYIMSKPENFVPLKEKSIIEKHKQNLINKHKKRLF